MGQLLRYQVAGVLVSSDSERFLLILKADDANKRLKCRILKIDFFAFSTTEDARLIQVCLESDLYD